MPTILVIDDSEFICSVIRNVFMNEAVEVLTVGTAREGIELVLKDLPDLILMDVSLPDMDGYSACLALKTSHEFMNVPIIFITSHNNADDILRGFTAGAVDYINKPFNTTELKARVNAHLKLKLLSDHMQLLNKNLSIALEENRRLAEIDPLTGLYNRRYGCDYMERYQQNPLRSPSVLLMGDVDDFKKVNDQYGHHTGDTVLCTISKIIQETIFEKGFACRWGGEEILIMLHDFTPKEAVSFGAKICEVINHTAFTNNNTEFYCSITLGVSVFDCDHPIEYSINRADDALYRGKGMGKNRCTIIK